MVQCYYKHSDGSIDTINSGICSGSESAAGYYSCCFPWDECLPDALCYSSNQTSYYTALCTDQTLQDSACQQGCNGVYLTGVTYNSSSNLWACCNEDTPCSTSSNGTFDAPAPDSLLQHTMTILDFLPSTSSTSSPTAVTSTSKAAPATSASTTSATNSTSPASSIATTNADRSNSSSLSTGAAAGIGIGATIGGLVVLAALVMWLLRRSRRRRGGALPGDWTANPRAVEMAGKQHESSAHTGYWESPPVAELHNQGAVHELGLGSGGNHGPHELSG